MRRRAYPAILGTIAAAAIAASVILAVTFANGNSYNALSTAVVPQEQVATAATLPFAVDLHTAPDLKKGDAALSSPTFRIETHWMDNFGERHCEECTMVEYIPGQNGFAGAAYVASNVADFGQAKKVVFFAMGENGGEKVDFKFAGKDKQENGNGNSSGTAAKAVDKVFDKQEFAVKTGPMDLKNSWQRYEVPLDNVNLKNVKYPFAFDMTPPPNDSGKIRFYLKGVTYDTEPAKKPIPVEKLLPGPAATAATG
jgi:hypothetical protein